MTARLRQRISTAATPSSKQRDAAPKPSNATFRVAARAALALTIAAPGAGGALVLGTALGTVLTAAAAAPPPLAPPFELPRLPMPAGIGQLVLPAGVAHPLPLVVTIPDAPGEDGRSEPYVELLAARGAAVLVLGLGEDADGSDPPAEPAASPEAVTTALAWAERDGRFDPRRIALVGFGAGGRAVLAAGSGRPAVALYPDCRDLLLPEAGPALVLHGGRIIPLRSAHSFSGMHHLYDVAAPVALLG